MFNAALNLGRAGTDTTARVNTVHVSPMCLSEMCWLRSRGSFGKIVFLCLGCGLNCGSDQGVGLERLFTVLNCELVTCSSDSNCSSDANLC